MPDLPNSVSVCGDSSDKFNGQYFYNHESKRFKKRDSLNQIYFDEENRFWVVFHPFRGHSNVGNYHSNEDNFELFGTTWKMAGDGQKALYLPGQTLSKSSDWSSANDSFTIIPGNSCPNNGTLPPHLFIKISSNIPINNNL